MPTERPVAAILNVRADEAGYPLNDRNWAMIPVRSSKGEVALAEVLSTSGISHHLEQLMKNATRELVIISPYLKVTDHIRQILREIDGTRVKIRLVGREGGLEPTELEWLAGLPAIHASSVTRLHAKCYLNEGEAIVTSMNLHESSQINNVEIGIRVVRGQDQELYKQVYEEAMTIVRGSKALSLATAQSPVARQGRESTATATSGGFCIRCGKRIKLKPKIPYCRTCYVQQKESADSNRTERFCHICGREMPSRRSKPVCGSCYRSHKDELRFPSTWRKYYR
jgi:hypothetical protein